MMGIEVPVPVKKEEKAAAPKKAANKKENKAAKPEKKYEGISLKTGFGLFNLQGPSTLAEVIKAFRTEFPGALTLADIGGTLKVVRKAGESVKRTFTENVTVAAGTYQTVRMVTDESLTAHKAVEDFGISFPDFNGVTNALYDVDANVLCPYLVESDKEPEVTFPASVGYEGEVVTVDAPPEDGNFKQALVEAYEAAYDVKLAGLHFNSSVNRWMPVYEVEKSAKATSTSIKKKEEKKVKLPVDIRIPGKTITLTPELVEGKEEVVAEDARKYLETLYFEYSKERTTMDYDETHNCFIAVLKSSSKGAPRIEEFDLGTFKLTDNTVEFESKLP